MLTPVAATTLSLLTSCVPIKEADAQMRASGMEAKWDAQLAYNERARLTYFSNGRWWTVILTDWSRGWACKIGEGREADARGGI